MSNSITPSIYKIDLNKLKNTISKDERKLITAGNIHGLVQAQYDKRRKLIESSAKPYGLILSDQQVGEYKVDVYKASGGQHPHPWTELFNEAIPGLDVKYPNLAAFFVKGENCYAISTGNGYTLFEQYIDTNFPLEAARHIMSPYLSATTERDIAGAVYGRDQQFRTSQLVVSSQNLGTVWQAIKGEVTEEVKIRRDFGEIYDVSKAKITVSAGSSLKIHKSIEIRRLAGLLSWIEKVLEEEISEEQQEAFEFLDGLREINPRKHDTKIEAIKLAMGETIYRSLTDNESIDFDFSHKNFVNYQSASSYHFSRALSKTDWSQPPTANEVLGILKSEKLISLSSGAELTKELSDLQFYATHEDGLNNLHGSIIGHLHGEIEYDNINYFLIDGKFYIAKDSFIERVSNDFDKLLRSQYFADEPDLQLPNYDTSIYAEESDYNDSFQGNSNWFEADRVFWENVEIADLFQWQNGKLYIIHNKLGFGVTVRDVCSQILHSMNIVNRMRDTSNEEDVGKYYDKIVTKHYKSTSATFTKKEFIERLLKTKSADIIYVIGYAQSKAVTVKSKSNIAKFEAVKLCNTDSRPFDFGLKIVHIPII